MAKTITFYEDKEKTVKAYPEIDPNGKFPGVSVGLADNLICEDGTAHNSDTFLFRSTAGDVSVSNGPARLEDLKGNAESTSIAEYLTYNLYATGVKQIGVDLATFKTKISEKGSYKFSYIPKISYTSSPSGLVNSLNNVKFAHKVDSTPGTYTFSYDVNVTYQDNYTIVQTFNSTAFVNKVSYIPGTYTFNLSEDGNWYLGTEMVTISQYGITLTGTQESGNAIVVNYISNYWKYGNEVVALADDYGVYTKGAKPGDTVTIAYSKNCWVLNNTEVTLSDYGVSIILGGAVIEDIIELVYQPQETGVVTIAYPKYLKTTGRNQFDKDGSRIFEGYSINEYGAMISLEGSYVIYFECLGGNTYTISNTDGVSGMVAAYSELEPTTLTTGMTVLSTTTTGSDTSAPTLVNDSTKNHYQTTSNGYMCIATTSIENLCCALTWSAPSDKEGIWEAYWESTLPIPYVDGKGETISAYGLAKVGDTYDEIDFLNDKFYKRIERVAYSDSELARLQALGLTVLFDSKYIYYPLTTARVYNLKDYSSYYKVDDFGTEKFEGSTLPLTASIFHTTNLKDKLRRDVEVVANKTNYDGSSTTTYPSSKALHDIAANLWQMLGLNVDSYDETTSYAIGDYVTYNHSIYKCTTASVGGLTQTPTNASITTNTSGVISALTSATFIADDFVKENGIGEYTVKQFSYVTSGGDTYTDAILVAPNGNSTSADSVGGLTISTIKGTSVITVDDGYWTKSYLFRI